MPSAWTQGLERHRSSPQRCRSKRGNGKRLSTKLASRWSEGGTRRVSKRSTISASFFCNLFNRQRGRVRRQRKHVVECQVFHDRLHQYASMARPCAMLEIVQLPHDVTGRAAGDAGHLSEARKPRPVTGFAPRGTPRNSLRSEGLAFLDTADRHIGDKARTRIAIFELRQVFRDLDDAAADRLVLPGLGIGQE